MGYAPIRRGRKTLREHMLGSLTAQRAMLDPSDPRYAENKARLERYEALVPPAPKARALRRPVDGKPVVPLERDVIASITDLLNVHPRVLFAIRINSGSSAYTNAAGKEIPLWFWKWAKRPQHPDKMRIVDFLGATVDCKILAIEAKREGWTKPTDERERGQAAFLSIVRDAGGIGIFATNAQQVADSLA